MLLERQLRVSVDLARDAEEVPGDGVDGRARALLRLIDGGCGCDGDASCAG